LSLEMQCVIIFPLPTVDCLPTESSNLDCIAQEDEFNFTNALHVWFSLSLSAIQVKSATHITFNDSTTNNNLTLSNQTLLTIKFTRIPNFTF
jgi:hypothetical protein